MSPSYLNLFLLRVRKEDNVTKTPTYLFLFPLPGSGYGGILSSSTEDTTALSD